MSETELYAPIKAFLEQQGYHVKAEVGAADVVAVRDGNPPLIVELKQAFSLALLHQAVERLALTDLVYVAVPRPKDWKALRKNIRLCRRLGIGVLTVRARDGLVEAHADPGPYAPRQSKPKQAALLKEFSRRRGDPNQGGARSGQVITAYRQDAEACRDYLIAHGACRGAEVAKATGVPNATRIMRDNHYGWFAPVQRGVYCVRNLSI